MAYRSIQICLEHEEQVPSLVDMAQKLTVNADSVIAAVHVETGTHFHQSTVPYLTKELLATLVLESENRVKGLKKAFETATAQHSGKSIWACHKGRYAGDMNPYIEHALVNDLTITEQPYSATGGIDLQRELLRQSGAPVIMVPKDITSSHPKRHVAIAWNGTIESARAVRDALPLLVSAQKVSIICISTSHEQKITHAPDEMQLSIWLQTHGIDPMVLHFDENRMDMGRKLIDHTQTHSVDLLVMGGFGHSRLYDLLIGAATGDVIRSAKLPVFLSH